MRSQTIRFGTGIALIAMLSAAGAPPPAKVDAGIADAAAQQEMAIVRTMVKRGVNVNSAQADGSTASLWALPLE